MDDPEVVVEVVVPVVDGLSATAGLLFEAIPGLMTAKKMITKMMARISKTIPTIIPMTSGLLVVQSKPNLTERLGSGTCI